MIGTTDNRVDSPETEANDIDIEFVLRQINAQLELEKPITKDELLARIKTHLQIKELEADVEDAQKKLEKVRN